MHKNKIAVCWAKERDKMFLKNSLADGWSLSYVNNFESLDLEMNRSKIDLALVKLEKGNVLDIINSKVRLKLLNKVYGVPIGFFVSYDNPFIESNYQLLMVDDTEIFTVNAKNFERVINNIIPLFSKYQLHKDEKSYHLDGRSYSYAM